MWQSNEG